MSKITAILLGLIALLSVSGLSIKLLRTNRQLSWATEEAAAYRDTMLTERANRLQYEQNYTKLDATFLAYKLHEKDRLDSLIRVKRAMPALDLLREGRRLRSR